MISVLKKYLRKYGLRDIFPFILLLSLTPLFFYKLGITSLISFDEGWYAAIAKQIVVSGNPLNIQYNGAPFFDHPPLGFWLMALSFKIFGFNEFAARFPSALAGFSSVVIIYLLGKELFNRSVGLASAFALVSSPWFLFRARSGNLDALVTTLFILSIYSALIYSRNVHMKLIFICSVISLFLSKTAIPITIVPVIIYIFYTCKEPRKSGFIQSVMTAGLLIMLWYIFQQLQYPEFFSRVLKIGAPGIGADTSYKDNLTLFKTYLHNGIGKWFWPGVTGLFLGFLTGKRKFLILVIFCISFTLPFLFSAKGHIWHLIPLYPFIILSMSGIYYDNVVLVSRYLLKFVNVNRKRIGIFTHHINLLTAVSLFIFVGYFAYHQTKRNFFEFVDVQPYISDEAILSEKAAAYPQQLYVDGDFEKSAVFYSGKTVVRIENETLKQVFEKTPQILLITNKWRLTESGFGEGDYQLIASDRDKVLVLKQKNN